VVSLGLSHGSVNGTLRKVDPSPMPLLGAPSGLAIDEHATYALYPTYDAGPQLVRVPTIGSTFEVLTGLAVDETMTMLQLDGDVALSRIVDGAWEITKLFPDAPVESRVTRYEASSPVVHVTPAGPGAFMLHREDEPSLVHVRCRE
jgi:hypothetical protein